MLRYMNLRSHQVMRAYYEKNISFLLRMLTVDLQGIFCTGLPQNPRNNPKKTGSFSNTACGKETPRKHTTHNVA